VRNRPADDKAAVALASVLYLTRSPNDDSGPVIIGVAISDMLSYRLAFGGMMMALYRRHAAGLGCSTEDLASLRAEGVI
tara:strand:+ start:222 stop:458 length:237 start_codon:yes stop_codon:yes gene_type:complete